MSPKTELPPVKNDRVNPISEISRLSWGQGVWRSGPSASTAQGTCLKLSSILNTIIVPQGNQRLCGNKWLKAQILWLTSSITSSFKNRGLSLGHWRQPAEVTGWGTVTSICCHLPPHLSVSSTTQQLKVSKSSAKRNGGSVGDFPVWSLQSGLLWRTRQEVEILWMGVGWDRRVILYQVGEQFVPRPLTPVMLNGYRVHSRGFGIAWILGSKPLSVAVCLEFCSPTWTQLRCLTTSLISGKPFKTFQASSTKTNGFKITQTMRGGGKGKGEWKYTNKERNESLKNPNDPSTFCLNLSLLHICNSFLVPNYILSR